MTQKRNAVFHHSADIKGEIFYLGNGFYANGSVLVDPATGEPYAANGGGGGTTDVSTLSKEATQQLIHTDIASIKADADAIKADTDSIKADVSTLKDRLGYFSTGYTLNAAGDLVSESESNGDKSRTRTWTYVTNTDGSITATPSAWSYA